MILRCQSLTVFGLPREPRLYKVSTHSWTLSTYVDLSFLGWVISSELTERSAADFYWSRSYSFFRRRYGTSQGLPQGSRRFDGRWILPLYSHRSRSREFRFYYISFESLLTCFRSVLLSHSTTTLELNTQLPLPTDRSTRDTERSPLDSYFPREFSVASPLPSLLLCTSSSFSYWHLGFTLCPGSSLSVSSTRSLRVVLFSSKSSVKAPDTVPATLSLDGVLGSPSFSEDGSSVSLSEKLSPSSQTCFPSSPRCLTLGSDTLCGLALGGRCHMVSEVDSGAFQRRFSMLVSFSILFKLSHLLTDRYVPPLPYLLQTVILITGFFFFGAGEKLSYYHRHWMCSVLTRWFRLIL